MCKILTIGELQEMKEEKEASDFLDNFFGNSKESNEFIDSLLEHIKYKHASYKSANKLHLHIVK